MHKAAFLVKSGSSNSKIGDWEHIVRIDGFAIHRRKTKVDLKHFLFHGYNLLIYRLAIPYSSPINLKTRSEYQMIYKLNKTEILDSYVVNAASGLMACWQTLTRIF